MELSIGTIVAGEEKNNDENGIPASEKPNDFFVKDGQLWALASDDITLIHLFTLPQKTNDE